MIQSIRQKLHLVAAHPDLPFARYLNTFAQHAKGIARRWQNGLPTGLATWVSPAGILARERARQFYLWDDVGDKIYELYCSLVPETQPFEELQP